MVHNLTLCLHKVAGTLDEFIDIAGDIFPYAAIILAFIGLVKVAYYTIRTWRSTGRLMGFLSCNASPRYSASITGNHTGNNEIWVFDNSEKQSAFTIGWFRPRIYLSSALVENHTPRELDIIVRHELGHRMRRDPLRQFLWSLLAELCWFIPIIRARVERMKVGAEIACDAYAALQGYSATEIAGTLVDIAGGISSAPSPKPAYNSIADQLELRVHALLGNNPWLLIRRPVGALVISILMIITLLSGGGSTWAKASDPGGIDATLKHIAADCASGGGGTVLGIRCPHCGRQEK